MIVGKDLLKAAEIRALASDYQEYASAYNTFKIKYNCVAGDCVDSLQLFGTAVNSDPSWGKLGDGIISTRYEARYVCQQLGLAGLIKAGCIGGYSTPVQVLGGLNALPSHYNDNSLMQIAVSDSYNFNGYISPTYAPYGNYLYLGKTRTGTMVFDFPDGGVEPTIAKSLDEKIDDGKPFSGKLVQLNYGSNCGVFATNTYLPSSSTPFYPTACPSYLFLGN